MRTYISVTLNDNPFDKIKDSTKYFRAQSLWDEWKIPLVCLVKQCNLQILYFAHFHFSLQNYRRGNGNRPKRNDYPHPFCGDKILACGLNISQYGFMRGYYCDLFFAFYWIMGVCKRVACFARLLKTIAPRTNARNSWRCSILCTSHFHSAHLSSCVMYCAAMG